MWNRLEERDSFSCSVWRLRNNHSKHSRVLAEFSNKVIRGTDGVFLCWSCSDLGYRAGQHLPAAALSSFPSLVHPQASSWGVGGS